MSLSWLILAMMAGAGGLFAAALFDPQAARSGLVRRARSLSLDPTAAAGAAARRAFRQQSESGLERLMRKLLPRPAALRIRLEATGHPITFTHYGLACCTVAAVGLAVTAMLGVPALLALLEAVATGLWLPHTVIGLLMKRRRNAFLKLFPDAIGLIVRGLRAGLPVSETIGVVGRELASPVGEDFRRIADQVRLGQSLEEAMWHTARRLSLPEFNFLVISLSVQRETGGNLAETLENLELILRKRQQMRLKIRAMASEATASALIIGALPFLMAVLMYLVSADYMRLLFTAPLGRLMVGGGIASLVVGGVIMRKMVSFEI
jgi:tight adherence protein B